MPIDPRTALRNWIAKTCSADVLPWNDATGLFDQGLLKSVQLPELILLIEELRETPVSLDELQPGTFRTVDAIVATFFDEKASTHA